MTRICIVDYVKLSKDGKSFLSEIPLDKMITVFNNNKVSETVAYINGSNYEVCIPEMSDKNVNLVYDAIRTKDVPFLNYSGKEDLTYSIELKDGSIVEEHAYDGRIDFNLYKT